MAKKKVDVNDLVGINLEKRVKVVKHAALKRLDDSIYRSMCPVCKEGILFMRRDTRNGILEETDNCILCGQSFKYKDIDKLRKAEEESCQNRKQQRKR